MMVSTSEKKQKKYVCKLCGVYFTSEFCHFLHLHVHADDSSKLYKFPCDSCDKKFKKASQLKCHKTTCRGAAESGGKDESGNLSKSTSSASKPRFSSRPTVTTVKGVRKKYQKALFRGKQKRKAGQIRQTTGPVTKTKKSSEGLNENAGTIEVDFARATQEDEERKEKQKELLELVKQELANTCGEEITLVEIGIQQAEQVHKRHLETAEDGEIKAKRARTKQDPVDDTGPPYICTECGKEFAKKRYLTRHQSVHTGEKPYICAICFKAFALKVTLSRHWRIHSGEKPFQCDICDKTFNRRSNLSIHKRIHEGVRPFKCDVEGCGKDFTQKSQLLAHALTHTSERPFECDECHKSFKSIQQLDGHIAMVHSESAKHSCDICGKGFPSANYLRVHRAFHTGDKPFQCEQCDKGFTIRHDLTRHMRVHSGIKPFKCEHCGFEVSRKSALVTHRRVHTGEKPYKCETCGKEFARNDTLVNHSRIHTGEKPHQCEVCGKEFSLRSNLLHHLKTHNKERAVKPRRPPGRRTPSQSVEGQLEQTMPQELIVPGHVIQGLLEIGNIAQLSLQTANVHQSGNVEQYQVITANIMDSPATQNTSQAQTEAVAEGQDVIKTGNGEQGANEGEGVEQQPSQVAATAQPSMEMTAALQSLQSLHAAAVGGVVETTEQGQLQVRTLGSQESVEMTVALQSLGAVAANQIQANVDMMDQSQVETITVDKDTLETLLSVFIPGLMAGNRNVQGEASVAVQVAENQPPLESATSADQSMENVAPSEQLPLQNVQPTEQPPLENLPPNDQPPLENAFPIEQPPSDVHSADQPPLQTAQAVDQPPLETAQAVDQPPLENIPSTDQPPLQDPAPSEQVQLDSVQSTGQAVLGNETESHVNNPSGEQNTAPIETAVFLENLAIGILENAGSEIEEHSTDSGQPAERPLEVRPTENPPAFVGTIPSENPVQSRSPPKNAIPSENQSSDVVGEATLETSPTSTDVIESGAESNAACGTVENTENENGGST